MNGGKKMNQKKIGSFLKELRKQKGITQEKFAEKLNVSGRTVSRWETGINLPDISLLVEIADFFDVSIPEIIRGERKSATMENDVKKVAESMSDYAATEKLVLLKRVKLVSIIGLVFIKGLPALSLNFLITTPSTITGNFGILGNIVNTLYIILC